MDKDAAAREMVQKALAGLGRVGSKVKDAGKKGLGVVEDHKFSAGMVSGAAALGTGNYINKKMKKEGSQPPSEDGMDKDAAAREMVQKVLAGFGRAGSKTKEVGKKSYESVKGAGKRGYESAKDAGKRGYESAKDAGKKGVAWAKEHPGRAAGIAAGTAAVGGAGVYGYKKMKKEGSLDLSSVMDEVLEMPLEKVAFLVARGKEGLTEDYEAAHMKLANAEIESGMMNVALALRDDAIRSGRLAGILKTACPNDPDLQGVLAEVLTQEASA